ncbi:hypothetical protein SynSYN20_01684 [Synechococcus sp. SYN20]|nr:hypothetical protein SynSYN20_01684 [Synechococcus sp. SYN20]
MPMLTSSYQLSNNIPAAVRVRIAIRAQGSGVSPASDSMHH